MSKAKKVVQQPYIPGLTERPPEPAPGAKKAAKDVPPELIEEFKSGRKQPVSALMEYSAMQRLETTFHEVPLEEYSLVNKFANQCRINGQSYPTGAGKTKKEAKTNAAKIAFTILLGLDHEDVGQEESGTVIYDSRGRKMVIADDPMTMSRPKWSQAPDAATAGKKSSSMAGGTRELRLQEYCSRMGIPVVVEVSDDPGPFGFSANVKVDNKAISSCSGRTKKEAKSMAIEEAIELLHIEEQLSVEESTKYTEEDVIAMKCYKLFEDKLQEVTEMDDTKNTFAAFLIKRGDGEGEIVALGSGNTCLSSEYIQTDGRSVVDSYAVAVARRALLKYFHKEIKSYIEGAKVMSIFEETLQPGIMKLKDHITVHLFLSQPPPGDYRECLEIAYDELSPQQKKIITQGAHFPAFNDELPGWFSVKNEDGVVAPVEEDQIPKQPLASLQDGEDLLVMSCSDKLLKWNVVGLQGGLFSNYVEPVYLTSIILGTHFDHGHLSRAVCCRVYDVLNQMLPKPYSCHHPCLTTVSMKIEEEEGHHTHYSINWSHGDEKVEVVNGYTGKVTENSPFRSNKNSRQPCASRLCKAAFIFRFREIANLLKQYRLLQADKYKVAKQMAVAYQKAKAEFREHCVKIGLGNWVRKPDELENFVK